MMTHLQELRRRLIYCLLVVGGLATLSFLYIEDWFEFIFLAPKNHDFVSYRLLNDALGYIGLPAVFQKDIVFNLQNVEMSGQFSAHIYIAFLAAVSASFPFIFYQTWAFVKPGLYPHERKKTQYVIVYSVILMAIGLAFGYFVVTPLSIQFFGTYQISPQIINNIQLYSYVNMVVQTTFYTGILFQLPVLIFLLTKLGLVNAALLRKYRRHAFLLILVVAAFLTPPDFITQIIVGFPLFLLYEVSIFVAYWSEEKAPQ